MTPEERAFCAFMRTVKPACELSTLERYGLAVALIAGAEVIEQVLGVLLGPPTTFVPFLMAVLISSRFLGAGPAWFTASLAAAGLAYEVPINERYVGTVAAYLAVALTTRESSAGSEFRDRGKGSRVSKNLLLARDWLAARLRLRQNHIEQRSAAQERAVAISFDPAR